MPAIDATEDAYDRVNSENANMECEDWSDDDIEVNHFEEDTNERRKPANKLARFGLIFGPTAGLFVWAILFATSPSGLEPGARRLAGMTVWIATWWLTEPIPLGITALLPLCAFPSLQIMSSSDVAKTYSTNLMWLFFGGFQLAFALQRAGLHKRIALHVMRAFGTKEAFLMLGVMVSVGFLSMFLSNTSTTLMLLPVVQAIVVSLEEDGATSDSSGKRHGIAKPMMLGLAYSASCGGMGSLIGTPPNGVLAVQGEPFGIHITFARWLMFGMPLSTVMIFLLWIYFVLVFKVPFTENASAAAGVKKIQAELGRMSQAEKRVGVVFIFTVVAWTSRKYIVEFVGLPKGTIEDDTVAIAVTIVMFLIPAKYADGQRRRLMDWESLLQTPWQLIFLFGGGFALAGAFGKTGLSAWMGNQLSVLGFLPPMVLVLLVVLLVTFLTEVTSNTATSNVLLPIIGQMAVHMGVAPAMLMVPATLAASCAFMLPVATPPNAIVFASGLVSMQDMARTGFLINIFSGILITIWMFTWGQFFFNT